jgi:ornithine cyclodeaminase/alanine dehydrogenase-like protein (mu-crystallin family)
VDDTTLTRASRIVVDSLDQAPIEAGDLASAVDRGLLQWSRLEELRGVVAGTVQGRTNADQIIYAKLMGTGVADVAAAKLAYDNAKAAGLGREMEW